MNRFHRWLAVVLILTVTGVMLPAADKPLTYDEALGKSRQLLNEQKLTEAYLAASATMTLDEKRWEAYALLALILNAQGAGKEAVAYVEKALTRAPEEKKATLREMAAKFAAAKPASPAPASATAPAAKADTGKITPEQRRRLAALKLILEEADQAKLPPERAKLLTEFLDKSARFVADSPDFLEVWLLRAAAALELNQPQTGWEAGQRLKALGADETEDAKVRKVMVTLDRKGWLEEQPPGKTAGGAAGGSGVPGALTPAPALLPAGQEWQNTLGLKFRTVPGTNTLMAIWETRVADFDAFVKATGHDATPGMKTFKAENSPALGHTWKNPGFEQTPQHPVCGVSQLDALAFCRWLTEQDRKAGQLSASQEYRLPTKAEWSLATGGGKYPWGSQWPLPHNTENLADEQSALPEAIPNYRDGFPRTAPVGSFKPNAHGFHDLGGNVREWCIDLGQTRDLNAAPNTPWDKRATVRGFCWAYGLESIALGDDGMYILTDRRDIIGFRLVVAQQLTTMAAVAAPTPRAGEKWENSLGMKFVPVPGTEVLFSIWHTRVQDFEAFAKATGRAWNKPNFAQGPTHPAVNVSWEDAKAFCLWLTEQERSTGSLTTGQSYRLPQDWEWSLAVGLNEPKAGTPKEKAWAIKDMYPWGAQWPPPRGAGNYLQRLNVDDYDYTSPVGSFTANSFGLYDMGGNAEQLCEDWLDPSTQSARVLRGACFSFASQSPLLSSFRNGSPPGLRSEGTGFRLVLVGDKAAIESAAQKPVGEAKPASKVESSPGGRNVAESLVAAKTEQERMIAEALRLARSRANNDTMNAEAVRAAVRAVVAGTPLNPQIQRTYERMTLSELLAAASGGDSDACIRLAINYTQGVGVTKDLAEAKKWQSKAVDLILKKSLK